MPRRGCKRQVGGNSARSAFHFGTASRKWERAGASLALSPLMTRFGRFAASPLLVLATATAGVAATATGVTSATAAGAATTA